MPVTPKLSLFTHCKVSQFLMLEWWGKVGIDCLVHCKASGGLFLNFQTPLREKKKAWTHILPNTMGKAWSSCVLASNSSRECVAFLWLGSVPSLMQAWSSCKTFEFKFNRRMLTIVWWRLVCASALGTESSIEMLTALISGKIASFPVDELSFPAEIQIQHCKLKVWGA